MALSTAAARADYDPAGLITLGQSPDRDAIRLCVLSLGAGVQSTTLALMAAHGEVGPMPDCAIFADTGWEPRAVREHLAGAVAPQLEGAAAFQLKVARNALSIVERELVSRTTSHLTADDEAALAASIRAGTDVSVGELAEVRSAVVDRLLVANPRWLLPPDGR